MSAKPLKVDGDPGRIRTCDPRFRKPAFSVRDQSTSAHAACGFVRKHKPQ